MVHYRIYMLDHAGKIFHGDDIHAPNDIAAIAAGRELLDANKASQPGTSHGVEIWRERQLVFRSYNNS